MTVEQDTFIQIDENIGFENGVQSKDSFIQVDENIGVLTTTSIVYTGTQQYYQVPTGVTKLEIDAYGAAGGSTISAGGLGGRVRCWVNVTPGEFLQCNIGGAGSSGAGGWNGGANPGTPSNIGSGGGGATDIRRSPYALDDRLVVAAGGGGAGGVKSGGGSTPGFGGAGGIPSGTAGMNGVGQNNTPGGGGPGTSSAGGAAGTGDGGPIGSAGVIGIGGTGGNSGSSSGGTGGGGGAGKWGGGGGQSANNIAAAGGGGGGSGLTTGIGNILVQTGVRSGNGLMNIIDNPILLGGIMPFLLIRKN